MNPPKSNAFKALFALCPLSPVAVLVLLLISSGCSSSGDNPVQVQKKAPLVEVENVASERIEQAIELTGEVVSVASVQISSTVEGPIGFSPWREGDHVEGGEKIIEIDRELYRAEVKAAEAARAVAEAKLDDLEAGNRPEEIEKARQSVLEAEQSALYEQTDFERISQLVKSGALPGEDLEKARVKMTAAQAKLSAARQEFEMLKSGFTRTAIGVQQAALKEAEAKLELAQARLNECVIAAPFTGTITEVFVRQGDMATVNAPLLRMADLATLLVRGSVPETHAGKVKHGMHAEVQLDAFPHQPLPAEVVRVYPELDPQMRTRTIELAVKENGADLAPGMFGRIRLIVETVKQAATIPARAIIVTPAGSRVVFVATEGKAEQRIVKTGIEASGRAQVLSGVQPGETIIVAGQENLKDGAQIRLPKAPENGPTGVNAND